MAVKSDDNSICSMSKEMVLKFNWEYVKGDHSDQYITEMIVVSDLYSQFDCSCSAAMYITISHNN